MDKTYIKLWLAVRLSGKIPKNFKSKLIERFIKTNITFPSWDRTETRKVKNLFYAGMLYRAYDVFTTSILALLLDNEISLYALMRIQLENYALTEYVLKNPTEMKDVFREKIGFGEAIKSIEDKNVLGKLWGVLSDRTHSFPEGLKTCFENFYILNPKDMKWGPCLSVKSHHGRIEEEAISDYLNFIITCYDGVKKNLDKIKSSDIPDEIESFSEIHKERFR